MARRERHACVAGGRNALPAVCRARGIRAGVPVTRATRSAAGWPSGVSGRRRGRGYAPR
ncbi:hypothetical protein GCM10010517_56880 [Streptosporangium fragile]|uniref:Uncharacterized protein n=1 Tax=Streptosporangium fragile TaxID=46186 RepID=A0ABP6IKH2_9ACTN